MRLAGHSAACTDAVLSALSSPDVLATGHGWATGPIEARVLRVPRAQIVYRMLDRLYRRGEVGRHGGRGTPWFSAYWRWWPSEGTCDQEYRPGPVDCAPDWCMRASGGCAGCRDWARQLRRGKP